MATKNKTTETGASVSLFLASVKDEKKRKDCSAIIDLLTKHTGLEAKMWGTSIVGFGSYHYTYESGREGDAPLVGISPRSNAISLYLSNVMAEEELLKKFGKHKSGKGCIYIQKLEDINTAILIELAKKSIQHLKTKYPG